jgi:hypothetical protein
MNRLHVMTAIQRCALEGDKDESTIYGKIRKLLPGAVNNGAEELLSRKEAEALALQSIHMVSNARFPVERARLALDIREGELRADVLDAIATLDLSNPRDVRDVYETHQMVASSIGEPSLRAALDLLAAADQDVTVLKARVDELFPTTPSEDAE